MVKVLLENIRHVYRGNVEAVKGVTLEVPDGLPIALLGPSGCGKTTLMKIIAGLLTPTDGRVYFDEDDVTAVPPHQRNVGMVFQFPVAYPMSVFENIAFPLKCAGYPASEIRKRVLEVAEMIGVKHLLNVDGMKLPPADRQKVALARALVRENLNVLILDEPLTNVPPEERVKLRILLKNIQSSLMVTSIFVTHDQTEAFTFAKRIAIMKDGKIVQFADMKTLFEKPANAFVGFFVGSPGMNILDCTLEEGRLNFESFSLPISSEVSSYLEKHGKRFKLGIRPENLEVSKSQVEDAVQFRCIFREFSGGVFILALRRDNINIAARTSDPTIREDEDVWVRFPIDKVRIYDESGEKLIL
ncbi:MAG: ABC transporter ATP-binding protein [Thaumarchaeota archaeon]|nr:ABC transporter ATP-binding protein [Nitrososphaerota archaeon]